MKRKQGLLFFLSSCIPGCGEMNQGYMKRGISLLTACCVLILAAAGLRLEALLVLLVPLWLYSFFDSYNLRTLLDQGAAPPDAYLFSLPEMDSEKLDLLLRRRHSMIGWGLVFLGLYVLWGMAADILRDVCHYLFGDEDMWLYYCVTDAVPRLVVTVLIISLGLWFIRGPKAPKGDDIPPFTPPEEENGHGNG